MAQGLQFSWTKPQLLSGCTDCSFQYSYSVNGGSYTTPITVNFNTTSITLTNFVSGGNYIFRVRTLCGEIQTDWVYTNQITAPIIPTPTPTATKTPTVTPTPTQSLNVTPTNTPTPTITPTPSPTNGTVICGGSFSGSLENPTTYYTYPVNTFTIEGATSIDLTYNVYNTPNKFSIYDGTTMIWTSGWKGDATIPGPWGNNSLLTNNSGTESIPLVGITSSTLTLRVETAPGGNQLNDSWDVSISCKNIINGGFGEGTFNQLLSYAPFIPTNNQVDSWEENTFKTITNGQIEFGVLKSIGGIGALVKSTTDNINLINTFKDGNGYDTGRSFFFSLYGTPGIGYDGVLDSVNIGNDTGFNPNPGGDLYRNRPRVLYYQKKNVNGFGDVIYTSTKGYIWYPSTSPTNIPKQVNVQFHFWFWLEGKSVRYHIIVENNRTDNQMIYQGREQEAPGCYSIGNLYKQYVHVGTPYINSDTIDIHVPNMPPPPFPKQVDTGAYLTSENWMSTTYGDIKKGLFLFTPYNSRFRGKQFLEYYGNAEDNESGYMNSAVIADMDNISTTSYSGYLYVGSESDFRTWLYNSKIPLRKFDFDFSGGKHQGWYTIDGRLKRENNQMFWYVGDSKIDQANGSIVYGSKIFSPFGNWSANEIQTITINANVYNIDQLKISWKKPGKDEENISRIKTFSVIGDGSARTYTINMSGVSDWNDIISQIYITHNKDTKNGQYPDSNAKVKLNWIKASY